LAVIIGITEMVMVVCAGVLSLLTPFMVVVAWARTIVSFSRHTSPLVWLSISVLLLVPIGLSFGAAEIALHGGITATPLQGDYLIFNSHPLWWLTSLIGLMLLILPPARKHIIPSAIVLASILYLGILLSAAPFLKAFQFGANVTPTVQLGSIVLTLGYFANPFVTLTFFVVSAFRPNKKFSIYASAISLGTSVICTFLLIALPFHD